MEYKNFDVALAEFDHMDCDQFCDFLREKFPNMFDSCFDFWIGKGWYPIVYNFCVRLQQARDAGNQISISQVKEKFATLRIYMNHIKISDDELDKVYAYLIDCEMQAAKTCENCGSTEEVTQDSGKSFWIKNYCKKCHEGRNK